MKWLDRLLMSVLMLLFVALSVLLIAPAAGLISQATVAEAVAVVYDGYLWRIVLAVAGVVLLVVSLKVLFSRGRAPAAVAPAALVKSTANGEIHVSLEALNELVQRSVRAQQGVKDMASQVIVQAEGGVTIMIQLTLMPEVNIPELTEKVQTDVKAYIQTYAGIQVLEARVYVDTGAPASAKAPKVV